MVFDFFDPGTPFERHYAEPSASPQGNSPSSREEFNKIRHEVERLLMITEALWTILKEQHGYNDETLQRRILEIDATDGRIDGRKASSPPRECPQCGRVVAKHASRCMWCDALTPGEPFSR